jgi:plastocyanin
MGRENQSTRRTKMAQTQTWSLVALLLGGVVVSVAAGAATLEAIVTNDGGDPVEYAVVYAQPIEKDGEPKTSVEPTVVDQIDKEYVPYVTAVRVGTRVSFPNHDQIRHHVYSFSPAKTFEIPLYKGTPAKPIAFETAGPVALGCNIHDWMSAYVFVSEAPYFAVTDSHGRAALTDLPAGDYEVEVWHPRIKGEPEATNQQITVGDASAPAVAFTIAQKRVWRARRSPHARGGEGYR